MQSVAAVATAARRWAGATTTRAATNSTMRASLSTLAAGASGTLELPRAFLDLQSGSVDARTFLRLVDRAAAARRRRGRLRRGAVAVSLTPWARLLPAGLASSVRIVRRRRQRAPDAPVAAGQRFVLEAPAPAPAPEPAAGGDDDGETLDDIFGGLAGARAARDAKRQAAEAERARSEAAVAAAARQKPPTELVRDPIFGEVYESERVDPQNARVHRHDQESGLRVFKAHALGLGRGGGTRLCPFDCNCCF